MSTNVSAPAASERWLEYFRRNAGPARAPVWNGGAGLSRAELFVIGSSIGIFQRAEEGSGRTIGRVARRYAERTRDRAYPAALQAAFKEEERHARDLARFMDLAGIARLQADPSDGAFRFLRHRAGLDGALCLLLTVESIACIYYRALRVATASPLLRQICDQILRDETQHVRFHGQRLALLRRTQSRPLAAARRAAHLAAFAAAVGIVALRHRSVLAAGLGNGGFLTLCRLEWRVVDRLIEGRDPGGPTRSP